jgi:glutathione synthase/RimK-type ligase-like ATP-grasp enzyme
VNDVQILIVSDKLDFTTDYVCLELEQRGKSYLRINRDEFTHCSLTMNVEKTTLTIERNGSIFRIEEPYLKSIYFRAPIYLRDIYQPNLSPESQLYRTQWTAFVRNLTIFDKPLWMNNPTSTFMSENKLLQLKYARQAGFCCPSTLAANVCPNEIVDHNDYIVKSIDTAILRIDDREAFVYSNRIKGGDLKASQLALAPVIIQEYIQPKIDLRVTVIGDTVYPVKILCNGSGVDGDWRQMKDNLQFVPCELPFNITASCISLVKSLGLSFGAIDLIQCKDIFYFIEINPTGEWGWLVRSANLPIPKAICDHLSRRMDD